jgi:hypothetical protein
MICQTHREEFESLGVDEVRSRANAGIWDEDKVKDAREWLNENEHGEDRA